MENNFEQKCQNDSFSKDSKNGGRLKFETKREICEKRKKKKSQIYNIWLHIQGLGKEKNEKEKKIQNKTMSLLSGKKYS